MSQRISLSLRLRFFAVLGGLLLFAMAALGGFSKWVVFPALQAEERLAVQQVLDRVERSLQLERQQLHAQVRDWAHWDDSYQFIQGDAPRYINSNFSQQVFEDLKYQLVAYFTNQGEAYFLAGVDPATGTYQTCYNPVDGCAWMAPWVAAMQQAIADDRVNQSALYAEQTPSIVAANAILRTDGSGPANGWLFKVRTMDDEWRAMMTDYTGLPITLRLTSDTEHNSDLLTFSGNTVHAERYFPLIDSPSALSLGIEINRTRYLTSLATFRYVLLWTAGLMLLVIVLVLLLLERIVLKPLRLLTQFTQRAEFDAPDPHRLTQRNDEIGVLSRAFQEQFACQQQLNAELLKLSTHDSLTGLPNRRLFDQRLDETIFEARATSTPFAIIMLDIDYFKLYNDHYGHLQGDECLQKVAGVFNELAIDQDFLIARTGGEEFSVLLPNASRTAAREVGEKLAKQVDRLQLPHATSPVSSHVTISVGIGMFEDSQQPSPNAVIRIADQALYTAKAAGRHQVVLYEPPLTRDTISTHTASS